MDIIRNYKIDVLLGKGNLKKYSLLKEIFKCYPFYKENYKIISIIFDIVNDINEIKLEEFPYLLFYYKNNIIMFEFNLNNDTLYVNENFYNDYKDEKTSFTNIFLDFLNKKYKKEVMSSLFKNNKYYILVYPKKFDNLTYQHILNKIYNI